MTRTAPRAISLENHKKKGPYEGHKRRSDRARETRTALLETRTALLETRSAKSMRVNDRMQNFVFFKMSNESEHSDSELYYPCELSDAELLQSPTYSESTERMSTLLTNAEVHNFIRNQQQANTVRNNLSGWTVR